jgi:transposase InsO family protein
MPLQGSLSIERMCHLAQVSRAGFYRYLRRGWPAEEELTLRSAIQGIVLEHRWRYGYRRVTAELRLRGMIANHKRVVRIMREDNLLAVRQERFSNRGATIRSVGIYLNLANRMRLSGPNQLWIGDITYIRLSREFVYLAVILDAFSRKVIGWSLARTLQTKLPLRALEEAIASRQPPLGVVHHSDQGVQYGCRHYMQSLREHGMLPSMSRPGNPYDDATCESFLKTLKREEIYANTYRDFEHLSQCLKLFIEQYYNRCRLHSALNYRSPDGFEREGNEAGVDANQQAAMVRFFGT